MDINGNNQEIVFPDGLITDLIEDESGTSSIELDATKINFESVTLCHNNVAIPTGASAVSNPMIANLAAASFDITGVGTFEADIYQEGGVAGELVKTVNTDSLYAGAGSFDAITAGALGNVAYGIDTLKNITSEDQNTAIGAYSQRDILGAGNTSLGHKSLMAVTGVNSFNVAIGELASSSFNNTQDNVTVGYNANIFPGSFQGGVCIGSQAQNFVGSTNNIVIGQTVTGTKTNQAMIGNASLNEIVNMGDGVCDIGSTANRFKNAHFSGDISTGTINGDDLNTAVDNNTVGVASLQSTTDRVAPRGLADDWKTTAIGRTSTYTVTATDGTIVFYQGGAYLDYSTDGGATINNATITTSNKLIVGFNAGLFVALETDSGGDGCFTSSDGITWAATASPPGFRAHGFNIVFFNGLWVTNVFGIGASRIATSGDNGATWDLRSVTTNTEWLIAGANSVVAISTAVSFSSYSLDGVTWVSDVVAPRALSGCYDSDKDRFVIASNITGSLVSTSVDDGVSWVSGSVAAGLDFPRQMVYQPEFKQFYIVAINTDGFFTLYSSTDPATIAFKNRTLPSSVNNNGQFHSCGYNVFHDSFYVLAEDGFYNFSANNGNLTAMSDIRSNDVTIDGEIIVPSTGLFVNLRGVALGTGVGTVFYNSGLNELQYSTT